VLEGKGRGEKGKIEGCCWVKKARDVSAVEHKRHAFRRWHREKKERRRKGNGKRKRWERWEDGKMRYEEAVSRDLRASSPVLRRSPEVQQITLRVLGSQ